MRVPQLWAGIDAGKTHHHCVVIDADGNKLLSRRLANREPEILTLLADVTSVQAGARVTWTTDLNHGGVGLLQAVLSEHGHALHYIPGRAVHHAANTYRGETKTDAKDAVIIADQSRMRHDLEPIRQIDDVSAELRLLSARREDLVHDRTRAANRLRSTLAHYFPALEAAFNYAATKSPLILLTRYQTPAAIRRIGQQRLTNWLKKNGARTPSALAATALTAAAEQHTAVHGEAAAARLVSQIAHDLLRLRQELLDLDAEIDARLKNQPHADLLMSVPGFGPRLAADFFAATGADLSHFGTPDRLASFAGLAPATHDSGKVSGNHHRPRRYDRRLLNACFQAAFIASMHCDISRAFYERKRREGKTHKQALIALARRRINVIWAILRDATPFTAPGLTP